MKLFAFAFLAATLSFSTMAQGLKVPVKSPLCTVKQGFGISDVTLEYSRPSVSNRSIFGFIVPFDAMWRTGANACTKLTFGEDVIISGKLVPAGTYSLLTIPSKTEWVIILNKNTGLWGTDGYSQDDDVLRFKVKTESTLDKIETFTMQFTSISQSLMTLEMMWESTKVQFTISVDNDAKIMKGIEASMAQDKRPFHQAASYYFENKKDLKTALEWATKAVEINPSAYWSLLLKAKIQAELKDYKGATATAESVIKIATAENDPSYVESAKELIEKVKKMK